LKQIEIGTYIKKESLELLDDKKEGHTRTIYVIGMFLFELWLLMETLFAHINNNHTLIVTFPSNDSNHHH
jgi:hypothetical protein